MIFALQTHIHILQLEGYDIVRFSRWWFKHAFALSSTQKKPLVWTSKAKVLQLTSFGILAAAWCLAGLTLSWPIILITVLSTLFLPLPLLLATTLVLPLDSWKKARIVARSTAALNSAKNLQTIGITGSYGKTSVKEFLFQILKEYQPTVRTPESYNTPLGIARTIELELTKKVRFFLCEMGAYQRGEIARLTTQVPLDYAILTAVGNQHLERFGSLENIRLGKFEIVQAVDPKHALVNIDYQPIREHLAAHPELAGIHTYSLSDSTADFFVSNWRFVDGKVRCAIQRPTGRLTVEAQLFGTANLSNLLAAVAMATLLGVPDEIIVKAVKSIRPAAHRLELKKIEKATLIDNAFSSNEMGFRLVMNDLAQLDGKKVLITPGIIELAAETKSTHYKLGQQAATLFDRIYLVGKSERTQSFHQGVKSVKENAVVEFLPNQKNLWPLIADLSTTYDWILLENDLPDNFE